ncbi:MAG: hypothetical protein IKK42_02390 [Oscillospiraceae bacterium]|nr:hypothetical protein [Oscillospiraceae bacterium]
MIIEIEYYKGEISLFGKSQSISELKQQFKNIETTYDKSTDNFIDLLCRTYQWTIIETDESPDWVYDRDTQKLYKPNL